MKRLFIFIPLLATFNLFAQVDTSLKFRGKAPTFLVGDGKYMIKTTPERFLSVRGFPLDGYLHFYKDDNEILPASRQWNSTFFPGGVTYDIEVGRDSLFISYGVSDQTGFIVHIKCPTRINVELKQDDHVSLYKNETKQQGIKYISYTQNNVRLSIDDNKSIQRKIQEKYSSQLVLNSPNKVLDKSVLFSQYLLDLGFNGDIVVCELFRWLDIWARDLGSGILPGCLASGRVYMARQSLDYDIKRYSLMSPEDCKNSNDPSQGGTASEIGWTARSIWNYYLFSGDKEKLSKDANIIRPWISHWINRDYDEDGLIIDVTEFMDHMIMMLTTNGVSTLAANSMYASMLDYFSKIEGALGNKKSELKLRNLYNKTVNALNTIYWNKEKEYFNNMTLWGDMCERSSQASQSMLLKIGATDFVRSKKTLDYLKKHNWCEYGSITIVPKMNHVGLDNDQNVKVWPWWNLWEAEACFKFGNIDDGYKLLDLAAKTIQDEKYPGFIEETLDTNGISIGGNVFVTAAGNLLDVVVKDLMGVESVVPGLSEIKVIPSVPDNWDNYNCIIPTRNGKIKINCENRNLTILINDPSIKTVYVSNVNNVQVYGAAKKLYNPTAIKVGEYKTIEKLSIPQLKEGKSAIFYDPEFHDKKPELNYDVINIDELADISTFKKYNKIIIQGNKLPLFTKKGISIKKAIETFVDKGGTIIFYGATVNAKTNEDGAGILGEQCGIIDWYQYLPSREKNIFKSWNFIPKSDNYSINQKNGTYSSTFLLDQSAKGKDIYFELGPLAGLDSVFVNDTFVAYYKDMEKFIKQEYPTKTNYSDSHRYKMLSRLYVIENGSKSYSSLYFNNINTITVKLDNDGMALGIPDKNQSNVGIPNGKYQWQPTDDALLNLGFSNAKRKGVNYWGNEQLFNSWSTKNGLFGFEVEGNGIDFCDKTILGGLLSESISVNSAYTDFAIFKPWTFEVLAYTTTHQNLLFPISTERYPCIVRIVNTKSNGGFVLITPSVVGKRIGTEILKKLKATL